MEVKVFNFIRLTLWEIVAELEYHLYPWKTSSPPQNLRDKYNLSKNETDYEENFNYDWLKSHDEKISRLQTEMMWIQNEINQLNEKVKKNDDHT